MLSKFQALRRRASSLSPTTSSRGAKKVLKKWSSRKKKKYFYLQSPKCHNDVNLSSMDSYYSCKSQLSHNFKVSPKKLHLDDEAYKSDWSEEPLNKIPLLLWLMNDAFCPKDILPLILVYCGPQCVEVLSRVCKAWRLIIMKEGVWREMCEQLHKWQEGDAMPLNWRTLYENTPIVPVDYSSIENALKATAFRSDCAKKILLRPARYLLKESLIIDNNANVTIESVPSGGERNKSHRRRKKMNEGAQPPTSKRLRWMTNFGSLKNNSQQEDGQHSDTLRNLKDDDATIDTVSPTRAHLILLTHRPNMPIVRIQNGFTKLKNLKLTHSCTGVDIWNGNASVQIQPRTHGAVARAEIVDCEMVSLSGRGVVAIDGGYAHVENSLIHKCAATGIYIGNSHQTGGASIQKSDIICNGFGNVSSVSYQNNRAHNVISRGHSGVYLEQGKVKVENSNISYNSLTGISAVGNASSRLQRDPANSNCWLSLKESSLVANGSVPQIDIGNTTFFDSRGNNNRIFNVEPSGHEFSSIVRSQVMEEKLKVLSLLEAPVDVDLEKIPYDLPQSL